MLKYKNTLINYSDVILKNIWQFQAFADLHGFGNSQFFTFNRWNFYIPDLTVQYAKYMKMKMN